MRKHDTRWKPYKGGSPPREEADLGCLQPTHADTLESAGPAQGVLPKERVEVRKIIFSVFLPNTPMSAGKSWTQQAGGTSTVSIFLPTTPSSSAFVQTWPYSPPNHRCLHAGHASTHESPARLIPALAEERLLKIKQVLVC